MSSQSWSTLSLKNFHNDLYQGKFHNIKYGFLYVSARFKHLIPQIIGKDGKNLKGIAAQSGVHYIWYNKMTDKFQIWGPSHESVNFCMLHLLQHIQGVKNR